MKKLHFSHVKNTHFKKIPQNDHYCTMFYSKFSKLSTCDVFLKGWTLATLEKYPFCSSFQVDEWPGTTMGTNQPATTSASAGTLKKHYILHSGRIVAAKHWCKMCKIHVCFFVFTFPLDCCLASQRPRWAIRTSCGGNTANGTQNTTKNTNN